jgi:nitrate/nitrite-specific signal transduction histidine kinase
MRERVDQMGGSLKISSARGKGTRVLVTLAYNSDATPPRADGLRPAEMVHP